MHECKVFGEWTGVNDPYRKLKCTDCHKFYYEIPDESDLLFYKREDGTVEKGKYKSRLVAVEDYNAEG